MAKADKSLDGLSLREMYRRKVNLDGDELRTKLKTIVANQIKTELQPYKAELTLTDNQVTKGSNYIFGGIAHGCKTTPIIVPIVENGAAAPPFSYKNTDATTYTVITNPESQFLIEYAIIPLGLKWRVMAPGVNNSIIISWKHWSDEDTKK
jgi:hypothetical protein